MDVDTSFEDKTLSPFSLSKLFEGMGYGLA